MKKKVLFLCTHNSCRSQMAEGLVNHFLKDHIEAYSAGTQPTFVHPLAIKAMALIGIDISRQYSKSIDELQNINFDLIITLCDSAKESCPLIFSDTPKVHIGFPDPAAFEGSDHEKLDAFIKTRDQMKEKLIEFLKNYFEKGNRHA